MDKTIELGGVIYKGSSRNNLNRRDVKYFKRIIAICYAGIADDLKANAEQIAVPLLDYAYISGLIEGGDVLMTREDSPEILLAKCIRWLTDSDLYETGEVLTALVNELNPPKAPDEPLPYEDVKPKRPRKKAAV